MHWNGPGTRRNTTRYTMDFAKLATAPGLFPRHLLNHRGAGGVGEILLVKEL